MIAILLFLGLVIIAYKLYKTIVKSTLSILAFLPDFFVIFFYACYYTNEWISKRYITGEWVYIVNVLSAIIVCMLYLLLVIVLLKTAPRILILINYIIVALGVSVAIHMFLGMVLTPIMRLFGFDWSKADIIPFFKTRSINILIHIILCAVISLPVSKIRLGSLIKIIDKKET